MGVTDACAMAVWRACCRFDASVRVSVFFGIATTCARHRSAMGNQQSTSGNPHAHHGRHHTHTTRDIGHASGSPLAGLWRTSGRLTLMLTARHVALAVGCTVIVAAALGGIVHATLWHTLPHVTCGLIVGTVAGACGGYLLRGMAIHSAVATQTA